MLILAFSWSASRQSLAISTSSETVGAPATPVSFETAPWLTPELPMRSGSSSWKLMGTRSAAARRMASVTRRTSLIGIPSSVKPTAPRAFRPSMSVSSFPCKPFVTAAVFKTWIGSRSARFLRSESVSSLSTAGFVFAMQITVVYPPAAALAAPVSMSSLYVKPGSRKCTCTSTRPGATIFPLASMTSPYSPLSGYFPMPSIFPSRIRISSVSSSPDFGSITCPFLISILLPPLSDIHRSHAHRRISGKWR